MEPTKTSIQMPDGSGFPCTSIVDLAQANFTASARFVEVAGPNLRIPGRPLRCTHAVGRTKTGSKSDLRQETTRGFCFPVDPRYHYTILAIGLFVVPLATCQPVNGRRFSFGPRTFPGTPPFVRSLLVRLRGQRGPEAREIGCNACGPGCHGAMLVSFCLKLDWLKIEGTCFFV